MSIGPTHYTDGVDPTEPKHSGMVDQPKRVTASYWSEQLAIAQRDHDEWLSDADEIMHLYRKGKDQKKHDGLRRYNILYANTETIRSAIYSKPGKPFVKPQWSNMDQDVVDGAEMLQRALIAMSRTTEFHNALETAVLETTLTGRGVIWIDYEPDIRWVQGQDEWGEPYEQEEIVDQKVTATVINRHHFLHSPAKRWSEVWWIARLHRMTLDDLKENGFKKIKDIPLHWSPDTTESDHNELQDDQVRRAEVWEIWSIVHRKRYFVVFGCPHILREDDDPYELENFWPVPRCLGFTPETETLIPDIEWHQYKKLADDLENVSARIAGLTEAMRRRGVYDSAISELKHLARAKDNQFIPVQKYEQLAQKGGLNEVFQVEDLRTYVQALSELYRTQAEIEHRIDKLSGIADVMRGNVDADEKLGQTQLKAQFGGLRIKSRQMRAEMYIADILKIEAELILTFFEPSILQELTQIEVTDELIDRLSNDRLRHYLVDIETDSTLFEDAEAQKAAVSEAVQATTSLMQTAVPLLQTEPELGDMVFELLITVVRQIRGGRSIEEAIDGAREKRAQRIQQMQQQAQMQPQQPDPAMQMEEMKLIGAQQQNDAKSQQLQMQLERDQVKHGMDMEKMLMQTEQNKSKMQTGMMQ